MKKNPGNATAADKCKAAGLPSLNYVSNQTGINRQTLIAWAKDRRKLFGVILQGCLHAYRLELAQQQAPAGLPRLAKDPTPALIADWLAKLDEADVSWHMHDCAHDVKWQGRTVPTLAQQDELEADRLRALACCVEHGIDIFTLYPEERATEADNEKAA